MIEVVHGKRCRLVNNRRRYHWDGKPGDAFRRILGWTLIPVYRVKAPSRVVRSLSGERDGAREGRG